MKKGVNGYDILLIQGEPQRVFFRKEGSKKKRKVYNLDRFGEYKIQIKFTSRGGDTYRYYKALEKKYGLTRKDVLNYELHHSTQKSMAMLILKEIHSKISHVGGFRLSRDT